MILTLHINRLKLSSLRSPSGIYCITKGVTENIRNFHVLLTIRECLLVMCDNDFTSLSIIMIILSRYDSYHDSTTNSKNY